MVLRIGRVPVTIRWLVCFSCTKTAEVQLDRDQLDVQGQFPYVYNYEAGTPIC